MTINADPVFAAKCQAINEEREYCMRQMHAWDNSSLDKRLIDAMLVTMSVLDERMAALKKKYYPRRKGRLSIALGSAILVSPTGRTERVWAAPRTATDDGEW